MAKSLAASLFDNVSNLIFQPEFDTDSTSIVKKNTFNSQIPKFRASLNDLFTQVSSTWTSLYSVELINSLLSFYKLYILDVDKF